MHDDFEFFGRCWCCCRFFFCLFISLSGSLCFHVTLFASYAHNSIDSEAILSCRLCVLFFVFELRMIKFHLYFGLRQTIFVSLWLRCRCRCLFFHFQFSVLTLLRHLISMCRMDAIPIWNRAVRIFHRRARAHKNNGKTKWKVVICFSLSFVLFTLNISALFNN